jgi:hypothetical protein
MTGKTDAVHLNIHPIRAIRNLLRIATAGGFATSSPRRGPTAAGRRRSKKKVKIFY